MKPKLPQLNGDLFLTDGGLETDLIFNQAIALPEFASHTLLSSTAGCKTLENYFRRFLELAQEMKTGFVLDTPTWRAQPYFGPSLGQTESELRDANYLAVRLVKGLALDFAESGVPTVINGVVGPRGDAYAPESLITDDEAQAYHLTQIRWLRDAGVDMVSAITFAQVSEAIGVVRAAKQLSIPVVVSFTVEIDGHLPTGQPLRDAIAEVDAATDGQTAYFMINCAHPDHFIDVLGDDGDWLKRLRGLRCNASRCSHAELDEAEHLDDGDPHELGELYGEIVRHTPWVSVLGGCCGTDLRHIRAIANAVQPVVSSAA